MKKIVFFALMFISSMQMLSAKSDVALYNISSLINASLQGSSSSNDPFVRKHHRLHSKCHNDQSKSYDSHSHCCLPGPRGIQGPPLRTAGAYVLTTISTTVETEVRGNIFRASLNPINPTSFGGADFFFDSNNNGFIAIPVHGFYLISYGIATSNTTEYHLETFGGVTLANTNSASNQGEDLANSTVILELLPSQIGLTLGVGEGNSGAVLDANDGESSTRTIPPSTTAFLSMTLIEELSP